MMTLLTAAIGAFEALLFAMMGRILDWLNGSDGKVMMTRYYVPEMTTGTYTASNEEGLGVDIIEAGFAAASPGDAEAIKAIAEVIKESTVCSLAPARIAPACRGVSNE